MQKYQLSKGFEAVHDYLADKAGLSPEEAANSKQTVLGALKDVRGKLPTSRDVRKGIETITGPLHEPQTGRRNPSARPVRSHRVRWARSRAS
jgi:hypothetical protein